MISSVGHVALHVPDLQAAVEHATEILGLREVERSNGSVFLTCGERHHDLQLIESDEVALDHIAFEAAGAEGLETLRETLARSGVRLTSEEPEEPGLGDAIRFAGPGGHHFEVYAGMHGVDPRYNGSGVRPKKFGHITIKAQNLPEMERFFVDVLGFRLSDRVGAVGSWVRCNPDHHGVAMIGGAGDGLHHYAWEVEGWPDLERLGDHLLANGKTLYFGPGRHGPGLNLFAYHLDGAGVCTEYFADLLRIYDDASWEPRVWPDTPASINQWGPPPPDDFLTRGIKLAPREVRVG